MSIHGDLADAQYTVSKLNNRLQDVIKQLVKINFNDGVKDIEQKMEEILIELEEIRAELY